LTNTHVTKKLFLSLQLKRKIQPSTIEILLIMKNIIPLKIDKRMNDAFLLEKTGKSLDDWTHFIDRFTSLGLSDKELSKLIHDNFKIGSLLQNSIISAYTSQNQSKKLNMPAEGIRIENSIELNLPLPTLSNLWSDTKLRNSWFPMVSYTVVRENPKKMVQLIWCDSISIVNIRFLRIDKSKSQVEIVHYNLPDRKTAQEMDVYWKKILQTLNESVTSDLFHSIIHDI